MSKISFKKISLFLTFIIGVICYTTFIGYEVIVSVVILTFFYLIYLFFKDSFQNKHSLLKNYPLIGRLRWLFEEERSKIQQYFVENDIDGTPYNREKRSDVYQKSKNDMNTTPFGSQLDLYKNGYEFLKHSMYPKSKEEVKDPSVTFGTKFTKKKFTTSIFNISAMSYGSLSDRAILSLNGGAKLGGFYHNTGEGGISPYHIENGGDLVYQIGTGYFGCGETRDGKRYFNEYAFKVNANIPNVKMIEIKLSQGAKPGKGGILPASKNTKEIAKIRGIEPNDKVISPPNHSAFNNNKTLLLFIKKLRNLSGGKPVGIKMCIGDYKEVYDLLKLMKESNIYPDFITIDGGEGGTGSAPLVYTNNIGTPLIDGLIFLKSKLKELSLNEVKIIASGKASTSFDIVKLLSLGADSVNSARSFMLSLGCIQARECNKDTCPVGIATQNKTLIKGLNVENKKVRVFNYHKSIIKEVKEVIGSMGLDDVKKLNMSHIYKRVSESDIQTFEELNKL